MDRDVRAEPLVLRSLPGRLRVHVPGWSAEDGARLEARLLLLRGVTHAEANPLTGNVLVLYDVGNVSPDAVLAALRGVRLTSPRDRLRRSPGVARRLAIRLRDVGCGNVFLLAQLALAVRSLHRWRRALGGLGALALALDVLALVQRLPAVRQFLGRCLGRALADLVRQVTAAAALLLDVSAVNFALNGAAAALQFSRTIGAPEPIAA